MRDYDSIAEDIVRAARAWAKAGHDKASTKALDDLVAEMDFCLLDKNADPEQRVRYRAFLAVLLDCPEAQIADPHDLVWKVEAVFDRMIEHDLFGHYRTYIRALRVRYGLSERSIGRWKDVDQDLTAAHRWVREGIKALREPLFLRDLWPLKLSAQRSPAELAAMSATVLG